MKTELKDLIGRKVKKIFLNTEYLKFETDQGDLVYQATGDCCSSSYFFDFYGVENLLKNGKVLKITTVNLLPSDVVRANEDGGCVQVYGYQVTTESEDYGDVTSVFSLRNSSNGYYGGSIGKVDEEVNVIPEIKEDVVEVK